MKLITYPKSGSLQDASLETLHAQTREWLSEIDFWIEEMAFFYNLIHMREPHIFFPTAGLADLERELITLTSDHLSRLKIEIENHERVLARMVKNISLDEEREYRERHRTLSSGMNKLEVGIREFKKTVFAFVN
jgi:hypothetical protein